MSLHRWRHVLDIDGCQRGWQSCRVVCNRTRTTNTSDAVVDPDVAQAKSFDAIPGIKGIPRLIKWWKDFIPFVGSYVHGAPISFPDIHMDKYKKLGAISQMRSGAVFVTDPDDIRKVFLHEGRHPYRDFLPYLTKYRKTRPDLYPNLGLLSENGERWHHLRSKAQVPMMRPQVTETYMPKMEAVTTDFVGRLNSLRDLQNEVPNLLNELCRWSLESSGLMAFNTRLGCLSPENSTANSESQRVIEAVQATFEAMSQLEAKKPWQLFPPRSKIMSKLATSQEYILSVAIKYSELTLEKMKSSVNVENEDFGIIGRLLQREDLELRDIHTFALDFLNAAVETTAHSFAFTLYLLARNMAEQKKVLEEIDHVIPNHDEPITPQILHKLRLVRATVKEAMRMLAAVEGTSRVLDHDVSLSGYCIPAGTTVFLATQVASLLPDNFAEADKFLPERWLSSAKPHPYSNLPFGHGPRSCIGRRVALQELHLLLIKILQKYRVEYHHQDIRRISKLVSIPNRPLRISFVERK